MTGNPPHRWLTALGVMLLGILYAFVPGVLGEAAADAAIEMEWAGHVKFSARTIFPRSGTAFDAVGLQPNTDSAAEVRLNNTTFFTDTVYSEVHWEVGVAGGGTRRDGQRLKERYPAAFPRGLFSRPNDDRRLFDLTAEVHADQDTFSYHRLDRALAAFAPEWGEIRLGRQAVTWGHGFTFNPMDLFNPFAPTDLERDYKMGDDMAMVRFPVHYMGRDMDVELLFVGRRDPDTGQAGLDESSLGAKLSFGAGKIEMDLIMARHYEDYVAGAGITGELGGAAWRLDLTGTYLESSRNRSFYLSSVANMDYSWTWRNKNFYGFLELYYNGLSRDNYADPFTDPALSERIARGELFALGSLYTSAHLNMEIHPLVNASITSVINIHDGSGMLLPRVVYDMSDNMVASLSAAVYWGGRDTEYGGYDVPGHGFSHQPLDSISFWITRYF